MDREYTVAKVGDLKDGQMKQVEVEGRQILLVRLDGQFHAYGATCPHQGAPLAEGVLHEGHIRCPWHQSIFSALTGEMVAPPTLDSLPRFEVRVDGDQVRALLPETIPAGRTPTMAEPAEGEERTFIILGAGAAGVVAAQTLRQVGFGGRIVMVTREDTRTYDRTELSKGYLAKADAKYPALRGDDFFSTHGIELLKGREVTEVDVRSRTISCSDHTWMQYDKLLLASGSVPRRLDVAGDTLGNVFLLRSMQDAQAVRAAVAAGARRAVVVGASFIAMEVGASLASRGIQVTVVAPDTTPFKSILGERIGRMLQQLHESKGTVFMLGARVDHFEGDGTVREVVLVGGQRLTADLVVAGVGVRPATEFLRDLETNTDGSVTVDEHLRAVGNVFAAGDIARFPDWRTGEPTRIEHWRCAQEHGRVAAMNMAGWDAPYRGVPFFWTNQFKLSLGYVGYARTWDEIVYDGDVEGRNFIAYYLSDARVLAAAGCDQDTRLCAIAEALASRTAPVLGELRERVGRVADMVKA
jgi:NADPH-dependent 2,4-dienoyl-CoA reductase/sulfur reductase-like enzyme/nitrite reductase/ring-hydroxylating ferredoxin subunit